MGGGGALMWFALGQTELGFQAPGTRQTGGQSAASYPPYRGTGTSCQAPGGAASGLFGGWVHLIGS
eukprot:scaffold110624_cov52-Phaeocystis_antarctica.AAC.1